MNAKRSLSPTTKPCELSVKVPLAALLTVAAVADAFSLLSSIETVIVTPAVDLLAASSSIAIALIPEGV